MTIYTKNGESTYSTTKICSATFIRSNSFSFQDLSYKIFPVVLEITDSLKFSTNELHLATTEMRRSHFIFSHSS